ncbi:MAG: hypothetical protein ICV83_34010 [Cytophagales bacterium]|nr:hypothetical protein [Cytophagales bacterium]
MNVNGKIEYRALPKPGDEAPPAGAATAPRNALERQLAGIWAQVFGREIGMSDNFFAIGGHSIIAARLVSRISA